MRSVTAVGCAECIWPLGAALGEGPVWIAATASLWFVDIKSDRIHRHETQTGINTSWPTPPRPSFLAPTISGKFLVGLQSGLHHFDPYSGECALVHTVETDLPGNRLNDGYVDARGRLWFGSMDDAGTAETGALYRYDARGVHCVDRGYAIANGPAVSPDGKTLYHTDTLARTTYAFDLDDDGNLSNKRRFASASRGFPDGLAVDSAGGVWSALYGGWGVDRYAPDGRLIEHYPMPCEQVTKIAFGGPNFRNLYITTARQDLGPDKLSDQPLAGGLFGLEVEIAGMPQSALEM